jgi:hypothetical protein
MRNHGKAPLVPPSLQQQRLDARWPKVGGGGSMLPPPPRPPRATPPGSNVPNVHSHSSTAEIRPRSRMGRAAAGSVRRNCPQAALILSPLRCRNITLIPPPSRIRRKLAIASSLGVR